MTVRDDAVRLMELGYDVLPLRPRDKKPLDVNWPAATYIAADIDSVFPKTKAYNLGLKLGVEVVDGVYPVAFDIDTEDAPFALRVRHAIGPGAPRKRGFKGQTIIARMAKPLKSVTSELRNRPFLKVYGKGNIKVELLGDGFQTVLPPSMHPMGQPYTWLTDHEGFPRSWESPPLTAIKPEQLPLVDEWTIEEIIAAAERPTLKLFMFNTMEWLGPDKGGNVHDVMVVGVGSLVAEGWPDDPIERRARMATRLALARSTLEITRHWSEPAFARDLRQAIEGARAKDFETKTRSKLPKDRLIADAMMGDLGGVDNLWADSSGLLRVYRDGHWPAYSEHKLRHSITNKFADASNGNMMQATNLILSALAPERETVSQLRICLKNGTFDLATGELTEWQRDDHLINQIPIDWNPEAKCPVYEAFLERTFSHDEVDEADRALAINCFEEFVGYTLVNSQRFHRMLVLKGAPRSGKSTLTEVVRMLHGEGNWSAVSLNSLSEPNQLAQLDGTMVNISGEVKITSAVDDEILKSIVAGDPVSIKRLYHDTVSKRISARLIVAGNEMFRTVDATGAIEARLLVLRCDNSLLRPGSPPIDPFLVEKLRDELPAIFVRVSTALRRLYDRERFLPPAYQTLELISFTDASNPLLVWVKERTLEGQHREPDEPLPPHVHTPVDDLYADYRLWCDRDGLKPMSKITFGQRLTGLGFASYYFKQKNVSIRTRSLHLIDTGVGTGRTY